MFLEATEGFVYQVVDVFPRCIQIMNGKCDQIIWNATKNLSINDDQMMRHIRIFLIFVANTDRNENNHCRIRVSF